MSNDLIQLEQQLDAAQMRFADALAVDGVNLPAATFVRSILVSVENNPRLLECTRQSLMNAAMTAACLGLPCDGATGQAHIIPFKDRAQLVIGYRGYNTLAARSGLTITGEVARIGDAFDFDEGEGWVRHKKALDQPQRHIIAVWAKAAAKDRPSVVKVITLAEVMAVKQKSPSARKADSPWNDPAIGFPAMAEKTAKRRLARNLPLNVMTRAAALEEAYEERGRNAWITPEQGLQSEPMIEARQIDAPKEPANPLVEYDQKLRNVARTKGMLGLRALWDVIPYVHQQALKSALDRVYKPMAQETDDAREKGEVLT